jgi:hypothetical protein
MVIREVDVVSMVIVLSVVAWPLLDRASASRVATAHIRPNTAAYPSDIRREARILTAGADAPTLRS